MISLLMALFMVSYFGGIFNALIWYSEGPYLTADHIRGDARIVVAVGLWLISPLLLPVVAWFVLRGIARGVLSFGRGVRDLYHLMRPAEARPSNLPRARVVK